MHTTPPASPEEAIEAMEKLIDKMAEDIAAAEQNLKGAAQCIAKQAQTIARLLQIEKAARNLANVKGRHHSEIAMNKLLEALK